MHDFDTDATNTNEKIYTDPTDMQTDIKNDGTSTRKKRGKKNRLQIDVSRKNRAPTKKQEIIILILTTMLRIIVFSLCC